MKANVDYAVHDKNLGACWSFYLPVSAEWKSEEAEEIITLAQDIIRDTDWLLRPEAVECPVAVYERDYPVKKARDTKANSIRVEQTEADSADPVTALDDLYRSVETQGGRNQIHRQPHPQACLDPVMVTGL